ncbi:MAG: hypothetical protein JW682_03555 [Campylobacterales bacterium]|nr:hypothetical protein [Campylobacterales bacterium]HEO98104.1 hypothetical protein [Campylobacterota bacterium]
MQKNRVISAASILAAIFVLSGCSGSSSDSRGSEKELPELESDGKTLVFYSASTNEQNAYTVDDGSVLNLQGATDEEGEDITKFNMDAANHGKLFVWIDNKGDANASNDEGKIVMFDQDYSYAEDGNATWEDFYYLGHFHKHEDEGKVEYHLAAHSNDEFNVTAGAKYTAMQRLNTYLAEQYALEQNLTNTIPHEANGLCGFHTFVNEESKTFYLAMGRNGKMYIYDENISSVDETALTGVDNCIENQFGMSSTEDGVLYFSEETQQLHLIDSHDDGVWHEHTTFDLEELLGAGKTAEMMVGIAPVTGQ